MEYALPRATWEREKLNIGDTLVLEIMKVLMVCWRLSVFGSLGGSMHSHVQRGNEDIELSHKLGEVFLFNFKEQMVMVTHKAIVVNGDIEAFCINAQQLFKVFIILRLFKNNSLLNTSIDDMVFTE